MADPKYDLSVTTPWILWSIVPYLVAFALHHALAPKFEPIEEAH